MAKKTIVLPGNIIRILEDKAKRTGTPAATLMASAVIMHMLDTNEIFICDECKEYRAMKEHGYVKQSTGVDVCLECARKEVVKS